MEVNKRGAVYMGIVISPMEEVGEMIMCAYSSDGGTARNQCQRPRQDGCTPGCDRGAKGRWELEQVLQEQDERAPMYRHSNWGYNEIILDTGPWDQMLPHAIEAFVFPAYPFFGYEGAHLCCNDRTREDAVDAHRKFLAKYGMTAMEVPLLEYSGRGPRPFREVSY